MYRFRIADPDFLPHMGCEIDLEINSGEVLTIVGENGIGKSSLMHRLFRENQTSISLVEQRPLDYFYDRPLSRIKNLFLKSPNVDHGKFSKMWQMFHLDRKEERLQSQLSGGESQALKLCLGLALRKEVFFVDEPSQYLDEGSRVVLNDVFHELIQENKIILLVEHDLTWIKVPSKVVKVENQNHVLKEGKSWTI